MNISAHALILGFAGSPALLIYAIVGPGTWLLFAVAMLAANARMNRLRRPRLPLPDSPPSVSVLVPAKDEGEGVRDCLETVLAQDYPRFTVLAVDDRSTDQTGAIMDELTAGHPSRMKSLHIAPGGLPAGWLGKCNALHTAAAQADGEWLLFVDSDVKVQPDALSTVLALAIARKYDAVSIMTRLECHGFFETLILPLAAASVGVFALMSLTNDDNRKTRAFANGQFFLIRRSAYEAVRGHEAVRDNITEDVGIMRNLKAADFRTRLYFGRDFASTRMHTSLRQMFSGWARIYSGVSNRNPARIVAAMMFLLISGLSVYVALAGGLVVLAKSGRRDWLLLALVHLLLITMVLAFIYRMSGNPRRYALAFPMGATVMIAIFAGAVHACRTGKIAWRGTSYTAGSSTPATPP